MKTVLFYVSGHGYGHAVRMSEVIINLRQSCPDWRILVRTQAPRSMFPADVEYTSAEIDTGVVEKQGGILVDEAATTVKLERFLGGWNSTVQAELGFVSQNRVDLIVADIPPIAGDVAHSLGIPCVGIANFTWDWIYEPYMPIHLLTSMREAYSHMDVLLRLPFAQPEGLEMFRRVVDAPLISRKFNGRLRAPCLAPPLVFLGSRAQVSNEIIEQLNSRQNGYVFLVPEPGLDFLETLARSDIVIGKLGFSMAADCIANQKPLLYPPRSNFREEAILQEQVPKQIKAMPIPLEDFFSGNWIPYLRRLREMEEPNKYLKFRGAQFCADFLASIC